MDYNKLQIFIYFCSYRSLVVMVSLTDINRANPWWASGANFSAIDPDIKGYNAAKLKAVRAMPKLEAGNIYLIKGPRRVGKTVALKLMIMGLLNKGVRNADILYYSFDGMRNQNELRNMLENFLAGVHESPFLLLDEIQNVDGWEFIIKHLYDSGALANAVTIITGSISHLLKKEMLPGRGIEGNVYSMKTLSFRDFCLLLLGAITADAQATQFLGSEAATAELLSLREALEKRSITLEEPVQELYNAFNEIAPFSRQLRRMFEVYMHTGGYPKVINDYLAGNYSISPNIADEIYNYMLNDASTLAGSALGDPGKAMLVLKAAIGALGNSTSYNKMARSVGMNQKTFTSYALRIENSYALLAINGIGKELNGLRIKKQYFTDVFMHYAVGSKLEGCDINSYCARLLNTESVGVAVEEIAAEELAMARETDTMPYNSYLAFFKKNNGREIDFVYKRAGGSYLGIEVKYQNYVSLKNDLNRTKEINDYIVLTKDTLEANGNALAVPVYIFLPLLKKSGHDL